MPIDLTLFLIVLLVLAALLQEDFVFTLLYLFIGVYFLGNIWSRRTLSAVAYQRNFPRRAFFGDDVLVRVEVSNRGMLPVVWLRIQDRNYTNMFRYDVSGPFDDCDAQSELRGPNRRRVSSRAGADHDHIVFVRHARSLLNFLLRYRRGSGVSRNRAGVSEADRPGVLPLRQPIQRRFGAAAVQYARLAPDTSHERQAEDDSHRGR